MHYEPIDVRRQELQCAQPGGRCPIVDGRELSVDLELCRVNGQMIVFGAGISSGRSSSVCVKANSATSITRLHIRIFSHCTGSPVLLNIYTPNGKDSETLSAGSILKQGDGTGAPMGFEAMIDLRPLY